MTKRSWLRKPIQTLLGASVIGMLSGISLRVPAIRAQVNYDIDVVLSAFNLQRTRCKSGNFVVIAVQGIGQVCAFPTQNYPAGIYRLNPQTYEMHAVGVSQPPQALPVAVPPPPPVLPGTPGPLPVGGPATPSPSIMDSLNPYHPVSPTIEVHIRGMLAKRGISLASCSQTPLTIFRIGRYTACAYPTPNYPAGSYQVEASLPF